MIFIKILFIIFMLILSYSFIEPYLFQKKITLIYSKKITDNLDGLKILFISDIHQGKIMPISRVRDIVNKVNSENPDIILLGGDYITWGCKINECFLELSNLKAKYGKFGVSGNHEHKTNLSKETISLMNKYGIVNINNTAVILDINGDKLAIGGVDDFLYGEQKIESLININENIFKILVSHNPDYVDVIKNKGYTKNSIDLMVSGDTHGGQVTFFGFWTPFLRTESSKNHPGGEYEIDNMKLIVSNGVGVLGVPLRFFAPPQINIIILKKHNNFIDKN